MNEGPLPDAFSLTSSRGLWRQAKTLTSSREDDETAFEPTPIDESSKLDNEIPEGISSQIEETNPQADEAIKSLEALSDVIDDVRMRRAPEIKSRLRSMRRRATRPAPSIAFAAAPQISTAEALEDLGYREDRPPMNPFEEQLRQA